MRQLQLGLVALSAGMIAGSAVWAQTDAERQMRRACAAYDLHATTILEEDGPKVTGSLVADAVEALVRARSACMAGRYPEGVAIYDTIALVPVRTTNVSGSR